MSRSGYAVFVSSFLIGLGSAMRLRGRTAARG